MSQDALTKMKCTETGDFWYTRKNKKGEAAAEKLELMKYNKKLRKRTLYKETKK